MIRTVLVLWIVYLFVGQLYAQNCRVAFTLENKNRYIHGEVYKECGSYHSPPWGNWGVVSNYGSRQDGNQFKGWYASGGHSQWNSCTRDTWEAPNCDYYNTSNCTKQSSSGTYAYATGVAMYGASCEYFDESENEFRGGCHDLNGSNISVVDTFMDLWELDRLDADDFVTTLNYNDLTAAHICDSCNCYASTGSWFQSHSNSIAKAKARIRIRYAYYTNYSTCPEI